MNTKEAERILREHDDAAMMATPDLWPMWPVLAVKRRRKPGEMPEIGTITDFDQTPPLKVYLCGMHALADGWVVD